MKAAICTIVKNEQGSLAEWITYHHLLGFHTCILIDDSSSDSTRAIAWDLSDYYDIRVEGLAEQGMDRQRRAYERVCRHGGGEFDWIAFVDVDEYLAPRRGERLATLFQRCEGHAAVALPWLLFGSSHHDAKPAGLTIEVFAHRSEFRFEPNRQHKSLVRPALVRRALNPHAFEVDGSYGLPDGTPADWIEPGRLRCYPADAPWLLHHYFTRSRSHWQDRMARGQLGTAVRTWADFADYDRNEVLDHTCADLAVAVRAEFARLRASKRLKASA